MGSFDTTLTSRRSPITRKPKTFKFPMRIAMDYQENQNAIMRLEATDEVRRNTIIRAFHTLSTDEDYIEKCMFDSVKERKSEKNLELQNRSSM